MKLSAAVLLVLFALLTGVAAQSGRKIKSPAVPPPSTPPDVQMTQDVKETKDETGYSESAPNAPRTLSVKSREDKKSKKEAKNETKPAVQTGAPDKNAAPDADEEVVRVETNLVTVPVAVYDRSGVYVSDLMQKDFKIFEDGVEQEIAYFGTSEKPFTVVLLIDVSPSTEYKIEEIQQAAIAFVDQLKPQDSVIVIQFDERVSVLSEATNDRQKIYKAINRTGFGGGTSLYDAVDLSLRKQLAKIEGRKAIVLFTDGVDTTSNRANYESTVRDAEESEALIFPIYYNTFLSNLGIGRGGVMSTPPILGLPPGIGGQNSGISSAEYTRGRAYLTELAAATGGRVFQPSLNTGGLNAAFEGIAEELRRQYSIGYYPQNTGTPGQRKQIKVRVYRPKLVIRSRDSYIVGANKSAPPVVTNQKFS